MATSFNLPPLQGPLLHKSHFLGQTQFINLPHTHTHKSSKQSSHQITTPSAKFNLFEILGGRGLLNGEEGLQKELKNPPPERSPPPPTTTDQENLATSSFPEDGFDKELLGLTGGFPGGEKGLREFIEKNPPPKKPPPPSSSSSSSSSSSAAEGFNGSLVRKPKAPELPLLMPGMIAIVKNPNSPYHMYCGIVQRITDGKAGVLFEGGNWDRLISFKLDELERREKGPPMVSPRSVALEDLVEKSS